ncbi:MAG: hypothetical protein FWC90_02535 [Oscillospiraceae bacterium]|nr:hypothetical protein [Oscillospiraceae bacterium]
MKININGIEVLVEDTDQYLQINNISGTDFPVVWDKLNTDYVDYDKWFCFRNVEIPVALLDELGAVLEDDCIQMFLYADKINESEIIGVEQVTDESFREFAVIHDGYRTDMYWTGERLLRDFSSRWGVFCLRCNGQISDYIIMSMWDSTQAEIFCVEASDINRRIKLIAFAARYAFDNEKTEVLYMVDSDAERESALAAGFSVTGFYKGYKVARTK